MIILLGNDMINKLKLMIKEDGIQIVDKYSNCYVVNIRVVENSLKKLNFAVDSQNEKQISATNN